MKKIKKKLKGDAKENITQILKRNEVKFISAEHEMNSHVFHLLLLDPPLAFYQLNVQWWVTQFLAAPHISPSPASRGGFY